MSRKQPKRNPHKLYRDKENSVLAGVCAGVSEYFGFNRKAVRFVTAISFLFIWPILIYILLAILLPVRPESLYENQEQENFWRGVSNAPRDIFGDMKYRFRDMELRLQKMEAYITSKEFDIDHELNRN